MQSIAQKKATQRYRENNNETVKEWKRDWYKKNAEKIRAKAREKSYSISDEQFQELLLRQNKRCDICGIVFDFSKRETSPHIDHNHLCCVENAKSCGKCIRGLLCVNCNNGLGRFKDNPELLEKAAAYLRR